MVICVVDYGQVNLKPVTDSDLDMSRARPINDSDAACRHERPGH
jgi:hypothetical protein